MPIPADGVLLFSIPDGLPDGNGGYSNRIEHWFDPTTRTASDYSTGPTLTNETYSRPASETVFSFCLQGGTAPFTERQYFHAGQGVLGVRNVDNAPACARNCTLTLTATGSAVVDGRGAITATVNGGAGALELSLDDFQTPGVAVANAAPHIFNDLRPGSYLVSARETRPSGCRATATVLLVAVYGVRYTVHGKDFTEADSVVEVLQRGYTGPSEELLAQQNPISIDYPGSATGHVFTGLLKGSEAQIALYLSYDEQLLPLFSGDDRLHRVNYSRAGALVWTGYLLPGQYDVAFLAPPTTFNLAATDGLGTLSDIPFLGAAGEPLSGDWSLLRIIRFCLDKLDLGLPLRTLINLLPDTAAPGTAALEETFFDVAGFRDEKNKPRTCGRVLADVLQLYQARLYQQQGAWWLERLSELTTGPLTYATYSATGTPGPALLRPSLLSTITPARGSGPSWREGSQRQNLRPAVARIKAVPAEDALSNALRDVLPTVAELPADLPRNWTARSPTTNPAHTLAYAGRGKTPIIRLFGESANLTTPGAGFYIETPLLGARSLTPTRTAPGPLRSAGYFVLSFTATPYGNTPATGNNGPRFYLAARFGQYWLQLFGGTTDGIGPQLTPINTNSADAAPDSPTPVESFLAFRDAKPLMVRAHLSLNTNQVGPHPLTLRLYAPVGGPGTPTTVDLTDLKLEWYGQNAGQDGILAPTAEYIHETGQQVRLTDEDNELFFTTTAAQLLTERRTGTLLDRDARPVVGFNEPGQTGVGRDAGDYFVRDRAQCEGRPAGVLTGTLAGPLPFGIGTLLTDPSETRPAVYALTSAQLNTADAAWAITAVALNALSAPGAVLPSNVNAIAFDDGRIWADEDGRILTYDFV